MADLLQRKVEPEEMRGTDTNKLFSSFSIVSVTQKGGRGDSLSVEESRSTMQPKRAKRLYSCSCLSSSSFALSNFSDLWLLLRYAFRLETIHKTLMVSIWFTISPLFFTPCSYPPMVGTGVTFV